MSWRPQDILLPDYDAATVAVGEDAMEGSLDEITSRFERSVLTQLYRNYPSTRKLAKRLGVHIPRLPISCGNMV
ncbi:DNA-binding transcriptional regulator TyrR [Escherichia coli]|uniref:DNA-binding transcriptional regulator TyrR n=1 Tax=Escherichia coli TaxID=562 RepID=A0A377D212_ECOLX|nr:DNA-binding transcriptional regulator TyrR [Escherichia coli]